MNTLKLEHGKSYRARNGQKVGPMNERFSGAFDAGVGVAGIWASNGKSGWVNWHKDDPFDLTEEWTEARQVRNETAEADRPLEPQTEGTHIHAALLAQDATGLFVTGLNAEEIEELRVLGQRTGGLIEVNPGKRKPMDSAGDVIRNYPDLASDLAADDEFTARFLKEVRKRGIPHFDPASPNLVIRTNNDFPTVAKTLVEHDEFTAAFLNALADRVHATIVAAGWWTDIKTGESSLHTRNVPEMLMLVVSEISEALEAVRKNLMDDKLPHRPGLTVELADAVIRILDLAGSRMAIERAAEPPVYGAYHPFGTVLIEKMQFNANREDHKIENRRGPNGKRI